MRTRTAHPENTDDGREELAAVGKIIYHPTIGYRNHGAWKLQGFRWADPVLDTHPVVHRVEGECCIRVNGWKVHDLIELAMLEDRWTGG